MIKNTFKPLFLLGFMISSFFLTAQSASDEDTRPFSVCTPEGANETRTSAELPNAVNVGTIDDRSCYANYKEVTIGDTDWGVYNITAGSNNQDTNSLQPRIERSLSRSRTTGVGSYARFTGTVRILEAAHSPSNGRHGTYIMQSKGKHSGGGGSADPAICLYRAEPVFGTDENGNQIQVSFNIVREQISFRGGAGAGRQIVFLTNIKKNEATDIELEIGFREDPNDSSKVIHYSDAVIGGKVFNWNIPEPERALESGIRYGAYRVWGGRAQIRWANTTYEKKEVAFNPNFNRDFVTLKNVATGRFLAASGSGTQPLVMADSGESDNTHWSFEESGAFVNIDSKTTGILRGPGANFSEGPFVVVSTNRTSPNTDNDKVWSLKPTERDNVFRIESGASGRYLYLNEDGSITHITSNVTDDRSNWEIVPVSEVLSVSSNQVSGSSINIYPNPAKIQFTIAIDNLKNAEVLIYDILGKLVYQKANVNNNIQVNQNSELKSGLYLVKVLSNQGKSYYKKLIIL